MEEWVHLLEYPNYELSNYGKIKSRRTLRYLHGGLTRDGYLQVTLRADGLNHQKYVHVLVAEVFVGRPYGDYEVNHIDGDKSNNHWDNLEWITHRENMRHAYESGLMNAQRIRVRIIETGDEFGSYSECADFLKVHKNSISDYFRGKQNSVRGVHLERID